MISKFKVILTLTLLFLLLISCNKQTKTKAKTTDELKIELKENEALNPLKYLSHQNVKLRGDQKKIRNKTLFKKAKYENDGATIFGQIRNNASLARFKDLKVKVIYYSATKTIIKEKAYILYEYFKPNSTNHFSLKVYPPIQYNAFDVKLLDAIGE